MPTTATSHRTRATLQQVAQSHATSRALSPETRAVFAEIADGKILDDFDVLESVEDAFIEAMGSCATRAGQSYARRTMVSDLLALREAVRNSVSVAPTLYHFNLTVSADSVADVDRFVGVLRAYVHDGVTVTEIEGV